MIVIEVLEVRAKRPSRRQSAAIRRPVVPKFRYAVWLAKNTARALCEEKSQGMPIPGSDNRRVLSPSH
jgi:hypothetical protein